ncbi:hypothetical protein O0Z71_07265 [Ligilactobacillus saerimneri]|uniref:hypothetical protein n=1 Tax=Ligilactobacillus saerimneri TaxID=228229 RepID=UPI0022A6AED1|nr:hypothetical protein [Ligilactobacillus saerimneri]MCZ0892222.1 hypothetical protein [Ligilactobacillus saerimneri]
MIDLTEVQLTATRIRGLASGLLKGIEATDIPQGDKPPYEFLWALASSVFNESNVLIEGLNSLEQTKTPEATTKKYRGNN